MGVGESDAVEVGTGERDGVGVDVRISDDCTRWPQAATTATMLAKNMSGSGLAVTFIERTVWNYIEITRQSDTSTSSSIEDGEKRRQDFQGYRSHLHPLRRLSVYRLGCQSGSQTKGSGANWGAVRTQVRTKVYVRALRIAPGHGWTFRLPLRITIAGTVVFLGFLLAPVKCARLSTKVSAMRNSISDHFPAGVPSSVFLGRRV